MPAARLGSHMAQEKAPEILFIVKLGTSRALEGRS